MNISDDDSDIDLEDDDEFFEQYRAMRTGQIQAGVVARSEPIKRIPLTPETLKNAAAIARQTQKAKFYFGWYLAHGNEINQQLRSGVSVEVLNNVRDLESAFTRIEDLFPKMGDYIIVFRTQTKPFDPEKNVGIVSTANTFLPGFGQYRLYIFIPKDVRVGLFDISKEVGQPNVYEVILPTRTPLISVEEVKDDEFFVVNSNFYQSRGNAFTKEIRDYARSR